MTWTINNMTSSFRHHFVPLRLLLFVYFCVCTVSVSGQQPPRYQSIVRGPSDTKVLKGDTAVLMCKVANQDGAVQWTKNGFSLGDDRELPRKERYSMTGSFAEGEYNLEIKKAELSDDANFQCQLGRTSEQRAVLSDIVHLTLLVPPTPPTLDTSDYITGIEDQPQSLSCNVKGGKPAASVKWVLAESADGSKVVKTTTDANEIVTQVGQLFNVKSTVRFIPKKEDNGRFLVCLASHEAITGEMATSTMLSINFPPKVKVTINTTQPLKEGDSALLWCGVEALPNNNLGYIWKRDGNVITAEYSQSLKLSHLGREHHSSVFECEVTNSVGSGTGSIKANVEYGPLFLSFPQNLSADIGKRVWLTCKAEGNPPPTIVWTKVGNPGKPLAEGVNFTIESLQDSQKGGYSCEAKVPGFESRKMTSTIHLNGPPKVVMVPTIRAAKGSAVEITCQITAFPPSEDIHWKKDSVPLDDKSGTDYSQRQFNLKHGEVVNILSLKKLKKEDFGLYTCSATNAISTDTGTTQLIERSLLSLYILIPLLIGGIVVVCCLVILILYCSRKQFCISKTTTHSSGVSDDHSDVTVKVEALDGSGIPMSYCPDMYSPASPHHDNGDLHYRKDYFPVPQDNPDMDLLPPPYSSYVHVPPSATYSYYNGVQSGSTFHPDDPNNPHNMVHMTYLDDQPMTSHQRILYSDAYGNVMEACPSGVDYADNMHNGNLHHNGNILMNAHENPYATGLAATGMRHENPYATGSGFGSGMESPIYYPSMINGPAAPLATLEPVMELPTPEEPSGGRGQPLPTSSASYSTFQPPDTRQPTPPTYSAILNGTSTPKGRSPVSPPLVVTATPSLHRSSSLSPPVSNPISTPSTNV